ncbi:MAG: hypothetical protein IPL22_01270 [Bacteroidetes bacterium]|nr:hypothetical protein [Bacteroidota bacterium]
MKISVLPNNIFNGIIFAYRLNHRWWKQSKQLNIQNEENCNPVAYVRSNIRHNHLAQNERKRKKTAEERTEMVVKG